MTLMAGQLLAQEICNNNKDDDGDGLIDCRDVLDCPNKVCEIPNDGIDNDGDGFIDCYDKETIADAACEGFFLGRSDDCSVPPTTFPPFEMKLKYKSPPNHANHITRLIAGDVDNDNVPELVSLYAGVSMSGNSVTSINTNKISIFQAPATGSTLGVTSLNVPLDAANPLIGVAFEDVAMADIDKDGCAEIFVLLKNLNTNGSYRMNAFHCDGTPVWASHISFSFYPGMIGLADFDGDGMVELYARTQIYDAHTGTLMGSNNIDNNNTGIHFNVNKGWGMNSNAPIAVNMDNVPGLELVAGCRIYNVAINRAAMTATVTLTKELANYATRTGRDQSNATSVADFNQDGKLDVLAVGSDGAYDDNTTIFFWDQSNPTPNTYKKYTDLSGSGNYNKGWHKGAGRVNIADIDGDTLMNAVYVSGKFLYALKETPTKLDTLWRRPVTEETSGITGCTMFDFNADGKSEIVYRDEDYIYIYTTENNAGVITVTRSTPMRCSSRTYNEYPIVVDMDGDGSTEICVTCSTTNSTRGANLKIWDEAEVRVYESANVPWVPARKVWNQHGYFVANVNDDLTIPTNQQLHHLVYAEDASCRNGGKSRPLNSFLNQSPFLDAYGCPSYATPDLTFVMNQNDSINVNAPLCPDNNFSVSFKFWNKGDLGINGTMPISYYNGNPTLPGATKLGTTLYPIGNMLPGDTVSVTNLSITGPGSDFTLFIVLNDDGSQVPTPIDLAILGQRSGIQECNYDNMLSVRVTPRLAALDTEVIQNFKCTPAAPDTGVGMAYVIRGGVRDSTSFDFYWFDGPVAGPIASADHVGHIYAQRPAGDYTVFAVHKVKGCGSDTTMVTIPEEMPNPLFTLTIDEVHQYDNCKNPNGVLKVNVDANGDGIYEPTGNYTYAWQDPDLNPVGVSHTATGLMHGFQYTVIVTDKANGCQRSESKTITDATVPVIVDTAHVDITCSNLSAGSVTATVGGVVNGYTFRWYDGTFTKPVADHTGSNYSNLSAGFYTVVAEDNSTKCESDSVIVEVRQTPGVIVTVDSKTDQTSCDVSQPNGSAVASVGGNTTNYTFQWFTGQNTTNSRGVTTNFINGLPMGVYTVKALDPLTGCSDIDTVYILDKVRIPTLTAVGSPMRKCDPLDGAVTATPSVGNLADYTFTWYDGPFVNVGSAYAETGNVLSGLKPGIYSVKAINNVTHCEAFQDSALVRNLTPTINITVIPNPAKYPTDCFEDDGEISATISSTGNTAGFTVDWFRGVRPSLAALPQKPTTVFTTNPVFDFVTDVSSDYYTIKVVNEDDGCQAFKEYFLPSKATDSLTITGLDRLRCAAPFDGSITAELIINQSNPLPSVPGDFIMQLYKVPSPTLMDQLPGAASTTFNFTPTLDSGRYYVKGIPSGAHNVCPVASEIFEIDFKPTYPTLELDSIAATTCTGGTPDGEVIAIATGPPALSYDFFKGVNNTNAGDLIQSSALNTLTGQLSGFYTTRVTAGNGCINLRSIYVPSDSATLIAGATPLDRIRCDINDGSITVNNVVVLSSSGMTDDPYASGTYDVIWSVVDPNPITEEILESLDSGTYAYTVVNTTTGCKSELVETRVEDKRVYPTINLVNFTIPTTCLKPADIMGRLQVSSNTNGGGTYSYNWFDGQGIGGALVIADSTAENLTTGFYTIQSINNFNFCERVDTFELPLDTAQLAIRASAAPLTFCSTDNGEVFAMISSPNPELYAYNWYYITSPQSGVPDFTGNAVTGLADTTMVVVAVDLNPALSHCTISDIVKIENQQIIPVVVTQMLSPNTICDNSNPDGIVAASVDGNFINFTYDWYETPVVNPSFASGSQISGLLQGTYTVIATHIVTGCADDSSAIVNFAPLPLPPPNIEILSHVTSCVENNGIVAANVNGITQGYTFKWYNGEFRTTPALPALHNAIGEVYDSLDVGFYSVTATDNFTQCVTDPAVAELIFDPLIPEFDLTSEPASCEGGDGRIFLTITNDIEIESIVWENIGSGVVSTNDPVLEDVPYGDYRVTVITRLGCSFSKDIRVLTDIRPFNGISRNGDGKNDYFHINCIEKFEDNVVRIYNRAGTLVYQEEKYNNIDIFFDGRANKGIKVMGDNLPDGTYFFIIDKRDGSKPVAGYLEIVN